MIKIATYKKTAVSRTNTRKTDHHRLTVLTRQERTELTDPLS